MLEGSLPTAVPTCLPFSTLLQGIVWLPLEHYIHQTKTLSPTRESSSGYWGIVMKGYLSSVNRKEKQANGQFGWGKSVKIHSVLWELMS